MIKRILATATLLAAIGLMLVFVYGKEQQKPANGFAAHQVIAHALGGINGYTYTNSYEAFIANYEQGTRVFEADLLLSTDNRLVARHEWTGNMSKLLGQQSVLPASKQGTVLTYDEFMDSPILDIYSPVDIGKLLDLLVAYPDAYLVTDTKELEPELVTQQFQLIVEAAEQRDPELLERIVPQIYSREMLDIVNRVHVFPEVIYTLYQSQDSEAQVIDFVKETGVEITMPVAKANKGFVRKLKQAGARVYVHTVNEEEEIVKLSRMGVDGFYTDFVPEDELAAYKDTR